LRRRIAGLLPVPPHGESCFTRRPGLTVTRATQIKGGSCTDFADERSGCWSRLSLEGFGRNKARSGAQGKAPYGVTFL
jgi:hypothetical protein